MDSTVAYEFGRLVPEMIHWNNGQGIDIQSWITASGTFELAIGYSVVFWPRFVLHEGMVFREGFSLDAVAGCIESCRGDKSAVEAVVNHIHLTDLHYHLREHTTIEQVRYLGYILRDIHQVKLRAEFPDRNFVVKLDGESSENLDEYQLTFYQER